MDRKRYTITFNQLVAQPMELYCQTLYRVKFHDWQTIVYVLLDKHHLRSYKNYLTVYVCKGLQLQKSKLNEILAEKLPITSQIHSSILSENFCVIQVASYFRRKDQATKAMRTVNRNKILTGSQWTQARVYCRQYLTHIIT